jgi:hypothetical protein
MNAAGYQQRAQRHRPRDIDGIRQAIDALAAQNLKPRDISAVLGVGLDVVIDHLYHQGKSTCNSSN